MEDTKIGCFCIILELLSPKPKKSGERARVSSQGRLAPHPRRGLEWHVAEQVGHRFAVVRSSDRLCQDHRDINNLKANRKGERTVAHLSHI